MEQLKQAANYCKALHECSRMLSEAGITDAPTDAWLLLSYVADMDRTRYYLHMNDPMPDAQLDKYRKLTMERGCRIPIQHLIGETRFMGLPFKVTPDVLVPRQDTEVLVEEALKYIRPGMRILDLCTGSGCIAVSLAKLAAERVGFGQRQGADNQEIPAKQKVKMSVDVTASDISEAALAVAKENAMLNGADILFVQCDLFSNIDGEFDIIVSNPPYIASEVIPGLEPEVALHEPKAALDGGKDGLDFYRRIIADGTAHLKLGGYLLFEIGYDQGEAVTRLLRDAGYEAVYVRQDLARLDRVVAGRKRER